ncbi:MAG TPA: ABC transporter ATP-binding protein [Bdellovibrionales bacterium]|nr:ABC transporter ATP-binding protein [Bdellovibrionales bacterium]
MNISGKSKPNAREGGLEAEDQVIGRPSRQAFFELTAKIWKHKLYFICGLLLAMTSTVATLLEPWLLGHAVDSAVIPGDMERLKGLTALLALVELARVSSLIGEGYLFAILGQKVMQDLRVSMYAHLLRIPVAQFDRVPVGRLVTRVTNDISSLSDMFASGFVTIIGNVLVALGILISLIVINWKLGLITASVLPALILLSIYFSKRLKIAYTTMRARLSALNAFLAENIQGMRTLHALNRQDLQKQKFKEQNEAFAVAQFASVRVFALFQPTITMCTGISMGLLIWYGGGMALSGEIKIGMLVSYFAYVSSLFQPVREVADKWNVILSGMTSAERVFSVLKWPLERQTSREPPAEFRGEIVFENVWFAYNDEDWVLRDFSLRIPAGERIGIVGPTGSGKTTLISLLMRFYEPQRGRILLDGIDLREWDLKSLRTVIGFIQQDVFLFSGTTKENITLWRDRGAPITTLKGALDHQLQEGGGNLSRGERQIISFCRALHGRPKLWILDEATANVDSESERGLDGLLREHSENHTALVIAHRLSTVRNLDRILVLNKGTLLEQGSHEDLLRQNGLYARLYRYQNLSRHELNEPEARHDHQLECKS